MNKIYVSLKVGDLKKMVSYYQKTLGAELLEETDTSVLMLLGDTPFELIQGIHHTLPTCLTIQFSSEDDIALMSKSLNLTVQRYENNVHKVSFQDIEGNIVSLSYIPLMIPDDVYSEEL